MFKRIIFLILPILFVMSLTRHSFSLGLYRERVKVEAKQIIETIKRGEGVWLDSCIIVGAVELGGGDQLSDTARGLILISGSLFQDRVISTQYVFLQSVTFKGCVFAGDVYFSKTSFSQTANFDDVIFEGKVHFDYTVFSGRTNFENANFHGEVYFMNSTFENRTSFWEASFEKPACFFDNSFNGYTEFGYGFFNSTGNFYRSKFNNQTFFTGCIFNEDVILTDAKFSDEVSFLFAEFKNFHVRWSQIKNFIRADYLFISRLIKNFEELRLLCDADECYLYLKNNERVNKVWYERYPEYWFIQQTCGYGVEPLLPLRAGLIVVALFAIPYYLIKIREPKWALGAGLKRIGIKAWNALYFSVNTFVSSAPIEWTPEDTRSSKRHYLFRILTTVEKTFGWILLVLFVVTLTRKFIR
jgi:uncharacterized protein YjbI with pentapeptide repeats